MRPLAIIPAYNEADILPAVLRHLDDQGCDVYVLDNWSTDWSADILARLGSNIERWPAERPDLYEWTDILTRIEEIALERGRGRWVILHDADEIRRVPSHWSTLTIEQALEIVSITGYNAVQFKVLTFVPTDNLWSAGYNPERHFRYLRNDHVDHHLPHVKAWFQGNERVDLHTNGGHQVLFPNRYVCPHPFILKHYPIRSQEHGERKVLKERFPRFSPKERSKQWHVQYDEYVRDPAPSFVSNPAELIRDKNNTTIVTRLRNLDHFHRLADSIERHDSSYKRIVVTSGATRLTRPGWEVISESTLNAGIAACGTDDVLCVRDDIEFVGPVVEELSDILYLTSAAMASAQVVAENGAPLTADRVDSRYRETRPHPPFGCVLIRKAALDTFGPLNNDASDVIQAETELSALARAHGLPVVMCRCRVKQGEPHVGVSSDPSPSYEAGQLALSGRN